MLKKKVNIINIFKQNKRFFFKIIHEKYAGIRKTMGNYKKTVGPGPKFYIPFFQEVIQIYEGTSNHFMDIRIKLSDGSFVTVKMCINYLVENSKYYYFNSRKPITMIENDIDRIIRLNGSKKTLNEIIECDNILEEEQLEIIREDAIKNGIKIDKVVVHDLVPDKELQKAMNDVMISEKKNKHLNLNQKLTK